MMIYRRTGPGTGIGYSLWGGLIFGFLVLLGALPFIAIGIIFLAAMWGIAILLMIVLIVVGVVYHALTGKDAQIPVPGSSTGTEIEFWMEDKGWIRLPNRQNPLTHTQIMSQLYGDAGLKKKPVSRRP